MIIETKYNIGDVVWYIALSQLETLYKWTVKEVIFEGIQANRHGTKYTIKLSFGCLRIWDYERKIFPTQPKAQAECDRRNGK